MDDLDMSVQANPEPVESFTQTVAGPTPEPAVEAAPEATEAPEPAPVEAPVVEPSWLNEPAADPMPQAPPQMPYPEPQYQDVPQQQYPTQQPSAGDAALNTFVENPDGWFDRNFEARQRRVLGPLQQQQQAIAYMMSTMVESQVNQGVQGADSAIRKAYDVFNKDSSFRSSKMMQEKIGNTLRGMRAQAMAEARNGNFAPLHALSNLSEADIRGTLAYVRAVSGVQSPGTGEPLQVEGAQVESSRRPVSEHSVKLDPETEAAIKRLGPSYRERYVKAQLETDKLDDFEG